jgi:hypothetical protein
MALMTDTTATYIDAKKLSKGAVRRFYDALEQRVAVTESLPDDDKRFEGDGIALMVGADVRGLFTYRGFASLHADTTLYYPFGGVLAENRHARHHRALIESLILKLKTDSKVEIIVSLDRQPMQQADDVIEDESFWFAQGFSSLDTQIHYQGAIKSFEVKDKLDFSVSEYAGGDDATNIQLCLLYREAYKRRLGIPNVTPDSINKQLAIPGCSYLVMRHKDALIGQVTLFITQSECYVDSIYVKRTYWGTGAADKLTQSLFNFAKTKGCQTVSGMAAFNNQASRALMERFGLVARYQVKRMILSL